MYTCKLCNKPQPANTASRKIILTARKVEYRHQNESISLGFEPVEETISCLSCPAPEIAVTEEKVVQVIPKKRKMRRDYESPRQAKVDSQRD